MLACMRMCVGRDSRWLWACKGAMHDYIDAAGQYMWLLEPIRYYNKNGIMAAPVLFNAVVRLSAAPIARTIKAGGNICVIVN